MKKKYFIFYIYILILSLSAKAQPHILKHLGIENGLSNNYVTDITQDSQGCIWIATASGLNRFDGKNFVFFKKNNSQLANNGLNTLFYDKKENKLWIGRRDGLSILDLSTNKFYNYTKQNVKINSVVSISPSSKNGIWITTYNEGIIFYDKNTKKFTNYSEKNIKELKGYNWCSLDDGKGHLFVGHAQKGLSIVDLKTKTTQNFLNDPQNPKSLPGNSVYSICIDHLGNIWVGTNNGLALYNFQKEEFLSFKHEPNNMYSLIGDHIYSIKEMKDGTLWIASDIGGISILDLHNITFINPKNIQFHNIIATNNNNGLSSGNIRSLLQDSFGNIWIGNNSSGLDFISHTKSPFHILPYYKSNNNFINKPVWGIHSDKQNQIWLGSENEIAIFKDFKLKKLHNLSPYFSRPNGQVSAVKKVNNTIFLGIFDDGLLKLNITNNHVERINLGTKYIDVVTFFADAKSKIWIGTEYGIYTYTNNIINKEDQINNQLSDKSVYGIIKDRQGKLWIGTTGSGIFVFDKSNRLILHLTENNGLKSNAINQLYSDSKGGIWATSRDGIVYFRDTKFPSQIKIYNEKQGLKDSYVRAIQEDKNGGIWVSSNNSISYLNKAKGRFDNYDYRDGLPTGNFIEGSACASNGFVYFGSLSGVCYFNPDDLITRNVVAPVQIIECKRFKNHTEGQLDENLILPNEDGITLAHNENSFKISYSVTDFSQNQQVEYAYMMEGLDNNWYNTLDENYVTFRNIPHGNYTFKVKARLRNQDKWDEAHIATLSISVQSPLWLTWYAKLLYAILIFFVIYKLLRFYKYRLELENSLELERRNTVNEQELNKERLRFYTNITHELRTPLTLILGPLEDLIYDKNLSSFYNHKINVIHNSALRLLNLINQILEFRKTETQNRKLTVCKDNIANLILEIGLSFKELNQNDKVQFHINIETTDTTIYFDSDIINSILKNLLSNAVKYTQEGEIALSLRSITEEDNLFTEIEVKDTGYGIDEMDLPHIFNPYFQGTGQHQASGTGIGLALVKALSDLHEGFLSVSSTKEKGTTFKFRLLTQNTYPDALHKDIQNPSSENNIFIEEEIEKNVIEKPILLVVEDNADIRDYICHSLENDFNIITAENGKTGLELAQNNIPNIIVSDIMMPVMDGIELCQNIKEDIRTSHIPVILLTAKDSIQDKEDGYEHGADSYLTKPFSAKLLRIRIQNILESRKKLAEQIASHTYQTTNLSQNEIKLSKLDESFLTKITSIVEDNLESEKLDISFMIEKMNMSHTTFYRKVKALTGMSANEFIRKIRLKNSLQFILSGSFNVSEAAYKSGFNDLGYFRTCFKEEYKISASEYLKQVRNNNKPNSSNK